MPEASNAPLVVVIGTDPAGLMVVEILSCNGVRVEVFNVMSSTGRKFLLMGIGGVNITHSEPLGAFLGRYRTRRETLTPLINRLSSDALRAWIHGLDIDTSVDSSGRVLPTRMKVTPLLRAWLHRLHESGAQLRMRHRWMEWAEPSDHAQVLHFKTAGVERLMQADAVVLAMGGGSWSHLGSGDAWVSSLGTRGVQTQPSQPANCGLDVDWSAYFQECSVG